MHVGVQIEFPQGLGSLRAGERYYFCSDAEVDQVLLIWFMQGKSKRWRVGAIHVSRALLEKELERSPPGVRRYNQQYTLPPALLDIEGRNLDHANTLTKKKSMHRAAAEARLKAIEPLLAQEAAILQCSHPLQMIASLGRNNAQGKHPHDLTYWFFCYVLHARNLWSLAAASISNGNWDRDQPKHAGKKFGRAHYEGQRSGWPVVGMQTKIIEAYDSADKLGRTMQTIYTDSMTQKFGCKKEYVKGSPPRLFHPDNLPFPSLWQFRRIVVDHVGLDEVRRAKLGSEKVRRSAIVEHSNMTSRLANLLQEVQIDAYRCAERPVALNGTAMPELVVARGICATSSGRVGIGFSLGSETQDAYRAMLWSMAVPKELLAHVYGIPIEHMNWPMQGVPRAMISDRGPAGQASLIETLDKCTTVAIKSITPSYSPRSKPIVEATNPKSVDPEGQPSFVLSTMSVAEMMKAQILRTANENRTSNIEQRLSPEMIEHFYQNGLTATPENLWKYLDQRMRTHAVLLDEASAVRTFLKPENVKVDARGIERKGMHYTSTELRDSGVHEKLVTKCVKTLVAYALSLVQRIIWVEVGGKLYRLYAVRKIAFDDEEELSVTVQDLENTEHMRRSIVSRTREAAQAERVEYQHAVKAVTGKYPESGRRIYKKPNRGDPLARAEAEVIRGRALRRKAA